MLGKEKVFELINFALNKSQADQTEVSINSFDSYLTRFANSAIHQNVVERNGSLSIRTIVGKKIGSASTNIFDLDSITQTLNKAMEIAKFQADNPDFKSLPKPSGSYKTINSYNKKTHNLSPKDRANAVKAMIEKVKGAGLRAFGSFTNGASEFGIGNSLGILAYAQTSDAFCNVSAMGENSSGYAQAGSRDVKQIEPEKVAERAAQKALDSKNPGEIEPGNYEVILEPLASAELLDYLSYYGFNAKTYQEGRSFLCDNMGKKVMGENIAISDDAYNEQGFAFPFDFEGVPKQKVSLIEKGVAKGLVYDSLTAGKENKESTGHGLPAPNTAGPIPLNLILTPGDSTLEQMISRAKKAILVTRFHYTNIVEPKKTIFTGMTRDGTFLIENGAITKPIKNLRFTESIVNALNKVLEMSQDLTLVGGGAGYEGRFATGTLVPALRIESFNFSGKTQF